MSGAQDGRLFFPDAIRGYAILAITANHFTGLTTRMGREGVDLLTLTQMGYSTSAELFVGVSGLLFGFVYMRRAHGQPGAVLRKSVDRAAKVYVYNLFLLSCLAAVCGQFPAISVVSGMGTMGDLDGSEFTLTALLVGAPYLAGVLILYVYLILLYALLQVVLRRDWAIVAASFVLYGLGLWGRWAGVEPGIRIGFDILCWQLIFVLPAVLGRNWSLSSLTASFRRPWLVLGVCMLLFVVAAVLKLSEVTGRLDFSKDLPLLFGKEELGPIRILHAVIVFVMLGLAFEQINRLFPGLISIIRSIGAVSLEAFCFSTVTVYLGAGVWHSVGGGELAYFVIAVASVLATGIFGYGLHRYRASAKPKSMRPSPA